MDTLSHFFKRPTVLITFSIVFIISESCTVQIFSKFFGTFNVHQAFSLAFFIIYTALCFFVAPAFISKFFMRYPLAELGLRFPTRKILTLILMVIALLLLLPPIIYFSELFSFKSYSLGSITHAQFFLMALTFFPLYYFSEEFIFRGFLFIGLWNSV